MSTLFPVIVACLVVLASSGTVVNYNFPRTGSGFLPESSVVAIPNPWRDGAAYNLFPKSTAGTKPQQVCGVLNGVFKTFSCLDEFLEYVRHGYAFTFYCNGPCPPAQSNCAAIYEPICASNLLTTKTFSSPCAMGDENYRTGSIWIQISTGPCPVLTTTAAPIPCGDTTTPVPGCVAPVTATTSSPISTPEATTIDPVSSAETDTTPTPTAITDLPDSSDTTSASSTAASPAAESTAVPSSPAPSDAPTPPDSSDTTLGSSTAASPAAESSAAPSSPAPSDAPTIPDSSDTTTAVPSSPAPSDAPTTPDSSTAASPAADSSAAPSSPASSDAPTIPDSSDTTTAVPSSPAPSDTQTTPDSSTAASSAAESTPVPSSPASSDAPTIPDSSTAASPAAESTAVPSSPAPSDGTTPSPPPSTTTQRPTPPTGDISFGTENDVIPFFEVDVANDILTPPSEEVTEQSTLSPLDTFSAFIKALGGWQIKDLPAATKLSFRNNLNNKYDIYAEGNVYNKPCTGKC